MPLRVVSCPQRTFVSYHIVLCLSTTFSRIFAVFLFLYYMSPNVPAFLNQVPFFRPWSMFLSGRNPCIVSCLGDSSVIISLLLPSVNINFINFQIFANICKCYVFIRSAWQTELCYCSRVSRKHLLFAAREHDSGVSGALFV